MKTYGLSVKRENGRILYSDIYECEIPESVVDEEKITYAIRAFHYADKDKFIFVSKSDVALNIFLDGIAYETRFRLCWDEVLRATDIGKVLPDWDLYDSILKEYKDAKLAKKLEETATT